MTQQSVTIGVMSDSHYDLDAIDNAVCMAPDVDCWFHAGDSIADTEYLAKVSGKKVYKVPGNVDWHSTAAPEITVDMAGVRIFMTHGHRYQVKWSLDKLAQKAASIGADLVIYGHSHVGAQDEIGGILFVNPGSVSEPRDGLLPSFMKIKITNGKITVKRIFLDGKNDKF